MEENAIDALLGYMFLDDVDYLVEISFLFYPLELMSIGDGVCTYSYMHPVMSILS